MGTCNATNSTSWWQSQENYYVPKINRISTHSVATQDTACPTIENMYEKTRFENGDLVVFNIFYRDINVGDVSHIKIFNPDGTVGADFTWAQNWGVFYPTAYAYWNFNITSAWQTGIYDIEVTFGGNTYHTKFGVRANLATENEEIENFKIYPNPVKDILYIKDFKNPESGEIIDLTGKLIKKIDSELKNGSINVNNLPKGNYLLKLKNTKQDIKTVNFIKK